MINVDYVWQPENGCLFAFWNFTTSWRKVRFWRRRRDYFGEQELIILGNRIREYRKERGFSQEILAEKSGVSTNTISRIEGGQMAMSVGILQKIVKALGVDANTLLGVSTEVNETKIWVSAFSSRVQELKENEQEILKHTMNALIESMEKNRLKISTDKSSQVLHTR